MPKKRENPEASFTVRFFPDRVEVSMQNFNKLTAARIQRSYPAIMEEWGKQQREVLLNQRKEDAAKAAEAAANEENTDAA